MVLEKKEIKDSLVVDAAFDIYNVSYRERESVSDYIFSLKRE